MHMTYTYIYLHIYGTCVCIFMYMCIYMYIYMSIKVIVIKLLSFSTSKVYSAFFFTLQFQSCLLNLLHHIRIKTVLLAACQLEISVYGFSCSFAVLSHSWLGNMNISYIQITIYTVLTSLLTHLRFFHQSYYS